MAVEIEKKFLVDETKLDKLNNGTTIKQGYIPTEGGTTVRVRIKGDKAFLTLKGKSKGITRSEFEYSIPVPEAEHMLSEFCSKQTVEKTRYEIVYGGLTWELDIFDGQNQGLILAEVELNNENQNIELPSWVTDDVSHDDRYYNVNLLKNPFTQW